MRNHRSRRLLGALMALLLVMVSCTSEGASTTTGASTETTLPETTTTTAGETTTTPPSGVIPAGEGARGVTDDEIYIGVELPSNAAASEQVGAEGEVPADIELQRTVQVIVDHINENGGMAGRTVVPVYHFTDPAVGSLDQGGQAACAFFTEDNEVFATLFFANGSFVFSECMAQNETVVIEEGAVLPKDQATFDALSPYVYWASDLVLDRFGIYVDALAEAGFFGDSPTIGLLRPDLDITEAAKDNVIIPALEAHGLELAEDFAFTPAITVEDFGTIGAESASAVLRFQEVGVDKVLFLPSMSIIPFLFLTTAESQGYRPQYGINSAEGPQFFIGNGPPAQLEGSMAVGWDLMADNPALEAPDNPKWAECKSVTEANAVPTPFGCTAWFFLKQALDTAAEVSAEGLRAAVDAMGTTQYSTQSTGTNWIPGRYDGVAQAQLMEYNADCPCYEYVGDPFPIP